MSRVREFLCGHPGRAQTAFVAHALGASRPVVYAALIRLHDAQMVRRHCDTRGRLWWSRRDDVRLTRKERILFALDRAVRGQLSTSKLGRAWGESNPVRAYQVLKYYRAVGLLEALREQPGAEVMWQVKQ